MHVGTGSLIYAIPVPPIYRRFVGPAHLGEVSGEIMRVCE
jgi:hypothetical protein